MVAASSEPDEWSVDLERIDEPIAQILERVANGGRRLVVRRGGRPLVVIEPASPVWDEEELAFLCDISDRFADVPIDEIDRQVEQAIVEVRRQRRARRSA
jgi:hypothetical protein